MTDLTEIDDVGPSRAADLEDAGYETAEAVADADPDDVDGLFGTTAGESLVANAQEATTLGDDVPDDVEEQAADESEDDTISDPAKEETYVLEPGFDDTQEYHLIAALVNQEIAARRTNDPGRLDAVQGALAEVRAGEPYELTLQQLSLGYTGINQLESEYRGTRGLADFVGGIREVRNVFQSARQENWPDSE
jgi:hypothetical protein